jgi:hypothetical protein
MRAEDQDIADAEAREMAAVWGFRLTAASKLQSPAALQRIAARDAGLQASITVTSVDGFGAHILAPIQLQSRAQPRLRRGPAGVRGREPQGVRHRQ